MKSPLGILLVSVLVYASSQASAVVGSHLTVVGISPAARTIGAPVNSSIAVTFDRPVDPSSFVPLRTFWAFAKWSGTVQGTYVFSNGNQTVTLIPDEPFSAGENVMVILSHDLQGQDGSFLRQGGYSFQFWTRAGVSSLDYRNIQTLQTTNDTHSQPYGGIGTDLNNDGWLDLTMVNEVTLDLRVFLNEADGTGLYGEFLIPTFPVGDRASPSDPHDFDRDGNADICVANIDTDNVSVLLGEGDGTFAPQQIIVSGDAPRGIASLDVDGDGDIDFVNTNSSGDGNLALYINDGSGVFGAPSFFEGGATGEWSLAAGDMNNDGLLDLVVGARTSQLMIVHTANGDGTFTQGPAQSAGGQTWMLVLGDVNGDGNEDVSSANSSQSNGSILLGNGAGQLGSPQTYVTDSFPLATDLGDLDGDNDLDWITSSFGGDWRLFLNDGDGNFTFDREFDATAAASCALMLDIDNDSDLDLALIDEIDDTVFIFSNGGPAAAVPATQAWGLTAMLLLLLTAGTIAWGRTVRA
ncbi:MAG: FG-GAP-like repeat-containing protein [Planctomycetota bacterium]|jgi:hypothetical protein